MTDLHIRNIAPETVVRIKRAAQIRGMTLAQYVTALSQLHTLMLDAERVTQPEISGLTELGLGRVEE